VIHRDLNIIANIRTLVRANASPHADARRSTLDYQWVGAAAERAVFSDAGSVMFNVPSAGRGP
jgi:hypothetical protein